MESWYDWVELILPVLMLPVLARSHRPYVALAWLAVILLLPITGTLACLYFGEFRVRRGRNEHEELLERLAPVGERLRDEIGGHRDETGGEHADLQRLIERIGGPSLGGWPAVGGNAVALHDDAERCLDALVEDVEKAQEHVHLLFYLFAPDRSGRRLGDAVARAARRGVRCRMLVGAYSSRFETYGSFFRDLAPELREAGVAVEALRPIDPLRNGLARLDLRNHRKLAVIDGTTAWVGSQNVHDPDHGLEEGVWHQLMARVRGPGAAQLQGIFLQDWCLETGECPDAAEVLPHAERCGDVVMQGLWWGPSNREPSIVRVLLALLGNARRQVHLCSPYFVPDETVRLALLMAAERGVEVHVVLPYRSDKSYVDAAARSLFGPLLDSGVHVHRHLEGGVLHSKCLSIDDEIALVGSGNCDQRSFYLDYELACLFYDEEIARRVRRIQERYIEESETVDPKAWRERSVVRSTLDSVAGLLGPLL